MKKNLIGLSLTLTAVVLMLVGCGSDNHDQAPTADEPDVLDELISVVATFSIIADMAKQVGGDLVEVVTLVPIGEDPHEHEVLPADIMAVTNADVTLYNGMNLETGYNWFADLMTTAGLVAEVDYFAVTSEITPLYLTTAGLEAYQDPHAWLDINNGIIYLQNIAAIFANVAPEHAVTFHANAAAEIDRLEQLRDEWVGRFDSIPEDARIVTTVEGAFRYFGLAFGLNKAYIWEINAHEEGTPEQMMRIINIINESNVAHLFVESVFVGEGYMEQVAEATGISIYATIYTDSLSEATGVAPTYYEMMRHNLATIYRGLQSE